MKTKYPSKHIEISLKPIFRINSRLKGLTIADIHRISFYPRGGTRVEIKSISRWNKPLDQSIDPRPPRTRPSLLIFVFVKGLSPSLPLRDIHHVPPVFPPENRTQLSVVRRRWEQREHLASRFETGTSSGSGWWRGDVGGSVAEEGMERRESECGGGGWGRRETRKMHRALIHENDAQRSTLARVYTRVHKGGMPGHARSLVKEHSRRAIEKDSDRQRRRKPSFAGAAAPCRLLFSSCFFSPRFRRVNTLLTSQTPSEIEPRPGFSVQGKKNIFNPTPRF